MRVHFGTISLLLGASLLLAAWFVYEPPVSDVGAIPEVRAQPDSVPVLVSEAEPTEPREVLERPLFDPPEPLASPVRFDAMPATIQVPAIDVDHPMIPVGLNPDGSMEIPHDVNEIGWYEPQGVLPGDDGTAVLAGHVDSRSQGPGAFFDLRYLEEGDEIVLSDDDDEQEQRWTVVARRSYDKDEIPIDDIFIDHGDPRLVLVTCGGEFDRTRRSYTDNIVVYAELS